MGGAIWNDGRSTEAARGGVAGHGRQRAAAGAALLCLLIPAAGNSAWAQKIHNTYGSPLDTIKNTHLTTTVPEAKDFVRQTRPDAGKLDYTPLTGVAPERPKPLDTKGIAALQAELEGAGAKNETKAKGLLPRKPAAHPARRAGPQPASGKSAAAAPIVDEQVAR